MMRPKLYEPFAQRERDSRRKEATARGVLAALALVVVTALLIRWFLAPALLNILRPALWH
jgi:hypothetical protein